MCAVRDLKRNEIKAKPKNEVIHANNVKATITKPLSPVKLLNYDVLMKKAEENSIIEEQKIDSQRIENEKKEVYRRTNVSLPLSSRYEIKNRNVQKSGGTQRKKSNYTTYSKQEFIRLNERKRDLRSIEEIQKDLKVQKAPVKQYSAATTKNSIFSAKNEFESESVEYYAKNYSSVISAIFGYDKKNYRNEDETDDSNMEADYSTIIAEEIRSTNIAKMEDYMEELKDMERKKLKYSLKRK